MPFWNLIPWTTFGNWFSPFNRRHVFAAALTSLNTMSLAVLADRAPLVRTVRSCTVANTLSIGFDVRRWSQCSAGKPKKASRASRSFVRHDCLVVPGTVLVGEYIDGRFGCRAGRRTVNFTKVCLHVDLDREGNLVQHVRGLVNPTPLVPGARKDLLNGLPEAERAVADRQVGRDLEPTLLDVDEEFTPALCALPHPGLEADQFLLAFGGRTDQHEHAFSGRFHPGLQVDPIRPHVYVSPGREVAFLPGIVIRLPFRG